MFSKRIGRTTIASMFMNAAGCGCSSADQLHMLDKIEQIGVIVSKTCTQNKKNAGKQPSLGFEHKSSINAVALANEGIDYYIDASKTLKKPFMLSIHPTSPQEFMSMCLTAYQHHIRMIEVNLSCPNVGLKKSFNDRLHPYIDSLSFIVRSMTSLTIGLKLPPFVNDLGRLVKSITDSNIHFVTCCNTLPGGFYMDSEGEGPLIANGFGGIGGVALKPISLAMVYSLRQRLPTNVCIIGCGGISSGKDVLDYLKCGASAVQIGTEFLLEGPQIFSRLQRELDSLIKTKSKL